MGMFFIWGRWSDTDFDGSGDISETSDGYALTTPGGSLGCRQQDIVKCGNNPHVEICNVQLCDGIPDCPNNEDEANCPHDSTGSSFIYHF